MLWPRMKITNFLSKDVANQKFNLEINCPIMQNIINTVIKSQTGVSSQESSAKQTVGEDGR